MPATKYIARLNGQIVGKRTSAAQRIYTHAIVVDQSISGWRSDMGVHVAAWCGRLDLAQGEANKWRKSFTQVTIVPAELV